MMRLTKVELRRLFSRRLTKIALFGTVLIAALMLIGPLQQAQPLNAEELANQQTMFAQAEVFARDCLPNQAEMRKTDPTFDGMCGQIAAPTLEEMGKPAANFSSLMFETLQVGAILLGFVGFVIGAGFVAAEFGTGSIGLWLTFEPRRMRVFASKLAAVCLGLIPVMVGVLGLLTVGVWMIVRHFGSTAGTTATMWGDVGEMAARSVALGLAAALLGAATGVLLRHTAAVLGVAIGYLVLVELIFGGIVQAARPWLLQLNVTAWLRHGSSYFVERCTTDSQNGYQCQGIEKIVTFGHSAAYLGAMVVLLVALAAVVFRRRDVT